MDLPILHVLYSCRRCGLEDQEVPVIERGAAEPLLEWMTKVQLAVCTDHQHRSPACNPETLTNLKIPIAHGEHAEIGRADRH